MSDVVTNGQPRKGHRRSVLRTVRELRDGVLDVRELVESTIADLMSSDLGVLEHPLGAIAEEAAEDSHRRLRSGSPRQLEGVPFGIKDIIAVAGAPTTYGSPGYAGFQTQVTATAVRRLMRAGAIPVAKLRTYEFAAGPNDLTANPHDRTRMSGGSSSGSAAAVGAGLLPFALGTDSGGSVRVPAAWCGAVGLKPTYGWVSRYGVAPLSWTLDHVGFLTTDPTDCRLLLDAVVGLDPLDPYSSDPHPPPPKPPEQLRVGVPTGWFAEISQPEVVLQVDRAARRLAAQGADVFEVEMPGLSGLNVDIVKHVLVSTEAASIYGGPAEAYGAAFAELVAVGRRVLAVDYARALRARTSIQDAVLAALSECDFLLTPGSPITAPPRGSVDISVNGREYRLGNLVARCTALFDITGHPAITVPLGTDSHGMPVGVQLVGQFWSDRQTVTVSSWLNDEPGNSI